MRSTFKGNLLKVLVNSCFLIYIIENIKKIVTMVYFIHMLNELPYTVLAYGIKLLWKLHFKISNISNQNFYYYYLQI